MQQRLTRFLAVLALAWLLAPGRLHAQAEEQLRQAINRFKNLEIERARTIFEQVLSPTTSFPVSEPQRVVAYTYLGAIFATLGKTDSAIIMYKSALLRDPLVPLDPSFGEQERAVFQTAKSQLFKVGMRPVPRDTIDPRTEHVNITVATTHEGNVRVELVSTVGDDARYPLFEGVIDGPRDIAFTGRSRGQLIPPGVYDLWILGESTTRAQPPDSTSTLLEIGWDRAPLADTVASFGVNDTLPTRMPASAATRDLVYGVAIAAGAILSSKLIGQSELQGRGALSAGVAVAGAGGGVFAFLRRRNHPEIPANVAENAARMQRRAALNGRIMQENNTRIDATKVIIRPLGT